MQALLSRVLSDYGLIVAGWSVQHDHALREVIAAQHNSHFTTGWVAPGELSEAAQTLVARKQALLPSTTADDAFGHLADQIDAMRSRRARGHRVDSFARVTLTGLSKNHAMTFHHSATTRRPSRSGPRLLHHSAGRNRAVLMVIEASVHCDLPDPDGVICTGMPLNTGVPDSGSSCVPVVRMLLLTPGRWQATPVAVCGS
jgi:hypothetical protein